MIQLIGCHKLGLKAADKVSAQQINDHAQQVACLEAAVSWGRWAGRSGLWLCLLLFLFLFGCRGFGCRGISSLRGTCARFARGTGQAGLGYIRRLFRRLFANSGEETGQPSCLLGCGWCLLDDRCFLGCLYLLDLCIVSTRLALAARGNEHGPITIGAVIAPATALLLCHDWPPKWLSKY